MKIQIELESSQKLFDAFKQGIKFFQAYDVTKPITSHVELMYISDVQALCIAGYMHRVDNDYYLTRCGVLVLKKLCNPDCNHLWGARHENNSHNSPIIPYCTLCGTTENAPAF